MSQSRKIRRNRRKTQRGGAALSRFFGGTGTRTPMHDAANRGNVDTISNLGYNTDTINAKTAGGNTPLILAARGGHLSTVSYLLSLGADPNIKNNNYETAYDATVSSKLPIQILRPILKLLGPITTQSSRPNPYANDAYKQWSY
jgi:ankyrin repeat protein